MPEQLLLADPPPRWRSSPEGETEAPRPVAEGQASAAQRLVSTLAVPDSGL